MKRIKVFDKEFEMSLSSEEIQKRVGELATEISSDMKDKNPVFLAILNGSFMFASDLFKKISIDAQISFLKLSSYQGSSTSRQVKQLIGLNQEINDMNVVILEDIVDTGKTIETIIRKLNGFQPSSIRVVTLLYKPEACCADIHLDYVGFRIPNKFVIGYGLDYNGFGRRYEDIYALVDKG